jgi:hypothetical protein
MNRELDRLVAAAGALPGEKRSVARPARAAAIGDAAGPPVDEAALRRRMGALLDELARRLEPAFPAALAGALRAWDGFDALAVVDAPLAAEADALCADAARLAADPDPARRAAGVAASLTLEAALGIVRLLERRLAALVRLRLGAAPPEPGALLPDGRPFLDVAAALAEAARGWQ